MGTGPTGYQTPKTDWQAADIPAAADLNRIEGNISAIETGERTVDPGQAPGGNTGTLRQLLDWLTNRIKAITGAANWYDAPATTLAVAKAHADLTTTAHGGIAPSTHVGAGGSAHANAVAGGAAGFMTGADKAKLDGIEAGATADMTATEMLNAIKTVDGAGSGLDADRIQGYRIGQYSAGDAVLFNYHDGSGQMSTTSTTMNKKFEGKLNCGGTLRVAFTLYIYSGTAYGQIYRNGVPIGTLRSHNSNIPTWFTEDISGWNPGDLLQLYIKSSTTSQSAGCADVKVSVDVCEGIIGAAV